MRMRFEGVSKVGRTAIRGAAVLLAGLLAAQASAQSLQEYLKLRHKYHISCAVGLDALDSFIGTRVVEVRGEVCGHFTAGGKTMLLLTLPDGSSLNIDADSPPDWLLGNQTEARLLIRASRSGDYSETKAALLGAAVDAPITKIEHDEEVRLQKEADRKASSRNLAHPTKLEAKDWNLPSSQALPYYTDFIRRENPKLNYGKAEDIAAGIIGFSIKFGVDARLIMAMVMVESDFDPDSTSNKGAIGLGQLMPGNAKDMGLTNAYDTMQNLYGTVRMICHHLDEYSKQSSDSYQDLVLALAAYNAGEGAVARHGGVPPYRETQAYVKRVVELYCKFAGIG